MPDTHRSRHRRPRRRTPGFLQLPSRNLLEVPANVTDDQAVFSETLAAASGITEQIDIQPETRVAVIGDGKSAYCRDDPRAKVSQPDTHRKHENKLAVAANRNIETILLTRALDSRLATRDSRPL